MLSNKKHIVFLRNPPNTIMWGGLERLLCEWFERIDYSKCRVTLVIGPNWKDIYEQYFKDHNLPINLVVADFDYSCNLVCKFFKTLKLLLKLKPNKCIFVQGRFFCFHAIHVLAGWLVAPGHIYMHENFGAPKQHPKVSKRYFGIFPGLAIWWYAEQYQLRLRAYLSKKVVCVSHGVKDNLVQLWHYPNDKIIVYYHGINLKNFTPKQEAKSLPKVILVSARLSQEKCIDRAIIAFDEIASNNDTYNLVILGSGPLETPLKDLAATCKSSNRIHFLGHVNDVATHLKNANYYILPSDNEGLGLSLLEAMASGLICIATNCPGPAEIIKDGVNGFLVEKNTEGVKQGLLRAISLSEQEEEKIKINAITTVRDNFEIDAKVLDVFKLINIPYKGL